MVKRLAGEGEGMVKRLAGEGEGMVKGLAGEGEGMVKRLAGEGDGMVKGLADIWCTAYYSMATVGIIDTCSLLLHIDSLTS